eukprot:m.13006 g.13006  ORF g.13006 m.13006 type:complete len:66 (+) comp24446_c0_seq1:358-555(+)
MLKVAEEINETVSLRKGDYKNSNGHDFNPNNYHETDDKAAITHWYMIKSFLGCLEYIRATYMPSQ